MAKKEEVEKEKKDFKVVYSCECTDRQDPEERFGDWSASYAFKVHSFSVNPPGDPSFDWPWETDTDAASDKVPEQMYCVWVRYKDGDTFGSSYGNGQIVGLFADIDLAHKLAKSIADETYKTKSGHYASWGGYFNRLESVEVDKIPRDDASAKYPKSYKPSY